MRVFGKRFPLLKMRPAMCDRRIFGVSMDEFIAMKPSQRIWQMVKTDYTSQILVVMCVVFFVIQRYL